MWEARRSGSRGRGAAYEDMAAIVRFAGLPAQRGRPPDFPCTAAAIHDAGVRLPVPRCRRQAAPLRRGLSAPRPASSSIGRGAARGRCPDRPSKPGGPCDHGWKVRLLRRSVAGLLSTAVTAPPLPGVDLLLERERELRCIDAAIAAARAGSGRSVVVEGPAGIGKSAVLAAARAAAEDGTTRVLRARGADSSATSPSGSCASSSSRCCGRRARPSATTCSRARRGWPRACSGSPGALRGGRGAGRVARRLVHRAPRPLLAVREPRGDRLLVLSVDDAHWADTSSLRFLTYLLARLEELKIALIVAARPEAEAEEARPAGDARRRPARRRRAPGAAQRAAVGRLVEARLGARPTRPSPRPAIAPRAACRSWCASWWRPWPPRA